ncbi:MAG: ABC transporter permease subunit [Treponemataceae bacterium]
MQSALSVALVTIIFSFTLGILCVIFEGRFIDKAIRFIMFFLSAIPSYLIGVVLIWFLSVKFTALPTCGAGTSKHYILPTISMAIGYCGFYFRMIRNSMLENINKNYVIFLRSCGVSERKIIKHILKNSLQTVITTFFMAIPAMIAGTVVIENIFAWPGLGRLCVSAIFNRDLPIIQAYTLLIAVFYCVFNVFADILNVLINPKLRKR